MTGLHPCAQIRIGLVILSAFPPKDEQGTPASELREAAEGSARVFCLCPDHTDYKTAPLLLEEFIADLHMKSETPTTEIALQRVCTSTCASEII